MVRRQRAVNNFSTTTTGAISDSATSVTLTSVTGLPTEGDFYLDLAGEIVLVTSISGSVLTIVRGQEGTTAASKGAGTSATDVITKGEFENRVNERMGLKALPYGRCTSWDGSTLTTVTSADFTLINSATGTSVADAHDGTIYTSSRDQTTGSNRVDGAVKSFGTGSGDDYRIIAHVGVPAFDGTALDAFGFMTRHTTGGTMSGLWIEPHGSISYVTKGSFLTSNTVVASHGIGNRNDIWAMAEIEADVTPSVNNIRYYYSKDGVNWWNLGTWSGSPNSHAVGLFISNYTGTIYNMRGNIFSWHDEGVTY